MKNPDMTMNIDQFLNQVKDRSDRLVNYFLWIYFAIGLALASFYDTWLIAVSIGGLSMLAYYSTKWALPKSNLYQYVLSVVMGIFMAQFIYQMHGMFEMHFFAFVGATILITYQNWKLQIPLALVVVVHHAVFGLMQYEMGKEIYFTQLDYMTLETFVIHGLLATLIFAICGLWAYNFHESSLKQIQQSYEIGKLQEADQAKETLINERRRSELALERSHSLVEATLESTADGILVTDHNGQIILHNRKFAQLWGLDPNDLSAMDETRLLDTTMNLLVDTKDFIQNIRDLYAQPNAVRQDVLKFKNGMVLERFSMPQMIGGQCVGRVWNFRDITERTLSEEMLAQQNRELVKTNAELDRFVYSASHELRAPLTSVLGLISVARLTEREAPQLKILEMMQVSIERLDIFIRDIVNYSSNSRLDLETEPVEFKSLIEESIDQLRYMPEMVGMNIVTKVKDDVPFHSDSKRIGVLLNNIISNAIKYQNTEQGQPSIHIDVDITPAAAKLVIKDNGVGIEEEYQDKIFNMFFRATQRKSGTGLGLYIVKEIIDRLHGEVHVESALGQGTTFYITIPNAYQGSSAAQNEAQFIASKITNVNE